MLTGAKIKRYNEQFNIPIVKIVDIQTGMKTIRRYKAAFGTKTIVLSVINQQIPEHLQEAVTTQCKLEGLL